MGSWRRARSPRVVARWSKIGCESHFAKNGKTQNPICMDTVVCGKW